MNSKFRNIAGWVLSALDLLLMGASAIDKISASAHSLEMTASFGISVADYRLLGVLELGSALLFVIPRSMMVGLLLLSSYLGGAIATHLQHEQSMLFPAAIEALVWVTAVVRYPKLLKRADL